MGLFRTLLLMLVLSLILAGAGYLAGGLVGVAIALLFAAGMNIFTWWNSGKIVLRMQGAQAIDEAAVAPVLRRFVSDVHGLADQAGLPHPKIYIIESPQPNAFATGRDPQNAAIAVTTGLLNGLSREEVAGVVAHELAHVEHRDTLTMTVTATIAGAISALGYLSLFTGGRGNDGRRHPLAGPVLFLVGPLAAALVRASISRSREYAADRRGAEICGNPLWLASALEKIERGVRASVNVRAQRAPAMAHLYIANPLLGRPGDNWFSTHPAIKNRVAALRRMASEMVTQAPASAEPRVSRGPWS